MIHQTDAEVKGLHVISLIPWQKVMMIGEFTAILEYQSGNLVNQHLYTSSFFEVEENKMSIRLSHYCQAQQGWRK